MTLPAPRLLCRRVAVGATRYGAISSGNLGRHLALTADGDRLAIGEPRAQPNALGRAGQVTVYAFANGAWTVLDAPVPGEGPRDFSGDVIALDANGTALAAGARSPDNGSDAGHVRAFALSPPSPLPVELASFAAFAKTDDDGDAYVELTWATTAERYSAYFEVQRSGDGTAWEAIGTVDAAGERVGRRDYGFADRHPLPGVSYYRLGQVDRDGAAAYGSSPTPPAAT